MAFTFTWAHLSGSTWQAFDSANWIGFYGASYGDKVQVGEYQDSHHLRTSSGTDTDYCEYPHMTNLKYISGSTVSISGSLEQDISNVITGDCVRIRFTDGATSINTENVKFYSFDGTTDATGPTGVTAYCLTTGSSAWDNAEGSGSAMDLADQGSEQDHDYFVGMSASPASVGEKTSFAWKITLDYY